MATNKTSKTNLTAKEPAQKATQTTLKVETEIKKPAVEVKADTKKEEPAVKVEEPKKEELKKEEVKPVEKKTAAKKPAARKTATRKTAARKTTARKTAAKKETSEATTEVFVQYQGLEFSEKSIMEKVKEKWEAEGKKVSAIKRVKLYVKPEDGKAYFVINEGLKNGSTGAVEL